MDIKTTDDARPEAFERSVEKWRYHVQAAFYLDGIHTAIKQGAVLPDGLKVPKHFAFAPIEKKAPHLNASYVLDRIALEIGRREYREDLDALAAAIRDDEWPGYPRDVQSIGLPAWRLRQEEITEDEGVFVA